MKIRDINKIKAFKLTVFLSLLLLGACSSNKDIDFPSIIEIKNNVKLNDVKVSSGTLVHNGDIIQTGEEASLNVKFNFKNIIKIGSKSRGKLNLGKPNKSIELYKGELVNIVRNLKTSKEGVFKVVTPVAVAAVRGTSFFVKIESPDSTYICICNGIVEVKGRGRSLKKTVKAKHHSGFKIKKITDTITVTAAPMLYHTDSDVEFLANKIGEKINWEQVYNH